MDKKNVQKSTVQTLLTDKKFCLDNKNLWCKIKPEIFNFVMIFF